MNVLCPDCKETIAAENINISSDLAKCDGCHSWHKVSELVEQEEIKDFSKPPQETNIVIANGPLNSMLMTYPKQGLSSKHVSLIIFAIFWLSFIAFWTWGSAQSSIAFALFSIPFWIVGFGILLGILIQAIEIQTLKLYDDGISIERNRMIYSKSNYFKYDDIQFIKLNPKFINNTFIGGKKSSWEGTLSPDESIRYPTIVTASTMMNFFEVASREEQEWIVNFTNSVLKKNKK